MAECNVVKFIAAHVFSVFFKSALKHVPMSALQYSHTHTHTNLYTDTCCALIWNKRNTADTQTSTQTKTRGEWQSEGKQQQSSLSEALIHHEAPNRFSISTLLQKIFCLLVWKSKHVGVYSSPSSPRSAAVWHRFISNWWQHVNL